MKKRYNHKLVLTPDNLTGELSIATGLDSALYLQENQYDLSMVCSVKTGNPTISVQFEPIEKIVDATGENQYIDAGDNDRLIYVGDTISKSTKTLVNGGASFSLERQAVKRFFFTAANVPTGATLTINLD